jgi:protein-S-isoprenylcysteine O-methyltransferase Ste14
MTVNVRHPGGRSLKTLGAWRHVRAIVLLPGTVAVVVPAVLIARNGVDFELLLVALGVPLVAAGFLMWLWTVRLFARIGRGTLAPWDPTTQLVVEGPYAHVRNPMISGVLAALLGEALLFGSAAIASWAAIFALINHVFFLVYEEPSVERRFGEAYRRYKQHVPRWIPRRAPWRPTASRGP